MSMIELKVPPLILVLVAGTVMWTIALAAPSFTWSFPHRRLVGLVIALVGGVVEILGIVAFIKARTTFNPTTPHAASSLVTEGIYRISRNPMYLGFLLALVGWAAFLGNTLSLAIIPGFVVYMNRFQIVPEERVLLAMFGDDFAAYMQRVRRWI